MKKLYHRIISCLILIFTNDLEKSFKYYRNNVLNNKRVD